MKEAILKVVKVIWENHRKKLIAFILGLLFAGIATLTKIPLSEIKEAAIEAASPKVEAVIEAPKVEEKVEEKK
jgi:uncharacterized membrane protein